jgi:hypothetical protein
METGSNRKLGTARHAMGAFQTDACADAPSAGHLPLLWLTLTLLMAGCVVVPIPANRPDPWVRTNITPQTVIHLGTGVVSRTEVLLQLGEPDEVSLGDRQFRYHTVRTKCDVFWVLAGGYNATGGVIEVKKYYNLVLRFDDHGNLVEGSWLDGWSPRHLRQRAQWVPRRSGELPGD